MVCTNSNVEKQLDIYDLGVIMFYFKRDILNLKEILDGISTQKSLIDGYSQADPTNLSNTSAIIKLSQDVDIAYIHSLIQTAISYKLYKDKSNAISIIRNLNRPVDNAEIAFAEIVNTRLNMFYTLLKISETEYMICFE